MEDISQSSPPLGEAAGTNGVRAAPPTARRRQQSPFSSLRHVNYRYLAAGTMFMSLGQWIQQVTLGYVMYDLTGSSVLLGLLSTVRSMPFLFISPLAGVIVDRVDRRKLLLQTQGLLAVTALTMGFFVRSPDLQAWHVFVFAIITASGWAVTQPLRQTLVPRLVPREDISNAVALNSMSFNVSKVLGPALGGLLIAWLGASGNFFVQGCAYCGVLISIGFMSLPHTERADGEVRRSIWSDLREGMAYVQTTPAVFALLIAAMVPSIIAMPYQTLMPVMQKDVLGVGPEGLGLMLAAPGLGAMSFTFLAASFAGGVRRKGYILLAAMAGLGITIVLFSMTRSLPLALLSLVGVGGFQILYATTNQTMLQLLVPDALMGRVMSIYMINSGFSPVGALFAGIMAQAFGAPITIAIMGLLVLGLAIVMFFRNPEMRRIMT
ncbi:MAG TPA: MFS transporter [Chloroflexota bacterium]